MKNFEYEITVPADSQQEADGKIKALVAIVKKLSAEELTKIHEVVNDPFQLAIIKSKLV